MIRSLVHWDTYIRGNPVLSKSHVFVLAEMLGVGFSGGANYRITSNETLARYQDQTPRLHQKKPHKYLLGCCLGT